MVDVALLLTHSTAHGTRRIHSIERSTMESTCVSYPNGCYSHAPNLRVRPVEEMKSCVVFRPKPPKLFMLNLNAWLIFELCDGSGPDHVAQRYRKSVAAQMSEREADRNLTIGINNLREQGLIELKITND